MDGDKALTHGYPTPAEAFVKACIETSSQLFTVIYSSGCEEGHNVELTKLITCLRVCVVHKWRRLMPHKIYKC